MAKRLTDRQKKKIIADYVELGSYASVARKHKVSDKTVKSVVISDPETTRKSEQKKEQNTADILAYMDTKKEKVCKFIDKYLDAMMSDEKIASATVNQLSTAFGTVIDKFTKDTDKKPDMSLMQSLIDLVGDQK